MGNGSAVTYRHNWSPARRSRQRAVCTDPSADAATPPGAENHGQQLQPLNARSMTEFNNFIFYYRVDVAEILVARDADPGMARLVAAPDG